MAGARRTCDRVALSWLTFILSFYCLRAEANIECVPYVAAVHTFCADYIDYEVPATIDQADAVREAKKYSNYREGRDICDYFARPVRQ